MNVRRAARPCVRPCESISAQETIPARRERKRRAACTRSGGGNSAGRARTRRRQPRPGRTVARTPVRPWAMTLIRREQRSVGGSSSEQLPSQGRSKLVRR